MSNFTRREFLKTGLAAGTLAVAGSLPLMAQRQTATDFVTLGRSGVKVTRLAFGTGSFSGQVQRDLGQESFTRLVRYAYDRGIRFFETAESYGEMHKMLGVALKGIPRESYQLMSKVTTHDGVSPQQKFDELRTLANTEYFDIMLLHWQHTATWPADTRRWQDAILEAEAKKVMVSHGASVHGLPALATGPGERLARRRHDPDESQGQEHGRRRLRHTRVRECSRSRRARKASSQRGNGRNLHEADRRRHIQPRGPAAGDEVCVQECRRRLRDRRLQKHRRNRRGD